MPSATCIKSAFTPLLFNMLSIASPVNPAKNPRAVFSNPRLLKTIDTLIPFPPGNINSSDVLFTKPNFKSSTETM